MPKAKPAKNRAVKVTDESETPEVLSTVNKYKSTVIKSITTYKSKKNTYLVILLLGLLLLAFYKKSWFVAAIINGSPISNFELLAKMNSQFREQTLNQMINEKIILTEARKNNVVVAAAEIDQKISELEKNVGGAETLSTLLKQQGQTIDSLRDQLVLQLTIEKLYEKDATVSAEEVDKFISENSDQLKATDSAEQIKEATDALKQQKLSQIFNTKFQQLKQSASIRIF